MIAPLFLAALPCALGPAVPAGTPAQSVAEGEHFRLIAHLESERAAQEGLRVVEAMWPLARELYGLGGWIGGRLDVHLYPDADAFARADERLAGGRFAAEGAFADHRTASAHVALQPPLSTEVLERHGLPGQTLRLLAHEAAHLVHFRAFPNFAHHPDWLVHGPAIALSQEAMAAIGRSTGEESDPHVATAYAHMQRLLEEGRLPSVDDILRERRNDLASFDRHYVGWIVFRFLQERHGQALERILSSVPHMGRGRTFTATLRDAVQRAVAAEGPDPLELDFQDFVRARRPEWDEVYRSLETAGPVWRQGAFSEHVALAWRTEPVGAASYELTGSFRILPGETGELHLLLGRSPEGFVRIAFRSGWGVSVHAYDVESDSWTELGAAPHDAVRTDAEVPFRAGIRRGRIHVALAGEQVIEADLGGRTLDGPFGLGCLSGTTGLWSEIEIDADPPPTETEHGR